MRFFKRLASTRLTIFDVIFLLLKIAFVVNLCQYLGVLIGLVSFIVINFLLDQFICLLFWVSPMNTTDKNVFFDQETNRCNIMGGLFFNKDNGEANLEGMR